MALIPSATVLTELNTLLARTDLPTAAAFERELEAILDTVNNLELNEYGKALSILDRVRIIDAWHDLLKRSGWLRLGTNESTAMQNCAFKWETLTSMVLWRTVDKYFRLPAGKDLKIFPMCWQTGTYQPTKINNVVWPLRYNTPGRP